jgi:hypothetical protein
VSAEEHEHDAQAPKDVNRLQQLILQALAGESLAPVKNACQRIFVARGQQPWPPHITTYPDWGDRYTAMANSLGMPITDLNEAVEVTHALIHAIDTS